MSKENESQKEACIVICAVSGDVRAARGVASAAIRAHIPKSRAVSYLSEREGRQYGLTEPRYTFACTLSEFEEIKASARVNAVMEGFESTPLDFYFD